MRAANQTTVELLKNDKQLRIIHLQDAINTLFTDESRVALLMLRDIINATMGFKTLSIKVGKSDKTLMGMLTGASNPTLDSISKIISALIENEKRTPKTTLKKTS